MGSSLKALMCELYLEFGIRAEVMAGRLVKPGKEVIKQSECAFESYVNIYIYIYIYKLLV